MGSACCGTTPISSQWPVVDSLPGPERVEAPVDHRIVGRRDPLDRDDRAEPEALERGQIEPADPLGEVAERVRAGVAVRVSVRQRADSTGIHDDHGRTRHCGAIMSFPSFAILKG